MLTQTIYVGITFARYLLFGWLKWKTNRNSYAIYPLGSISNDLE